MNRYLVLISVFLAVVACKTQSTIAHRAHYPTIGDSRTIRDSVSITYKQGKELPTPTGVRVAAIESICVIDEGLPEIATGATSSELATTAGPSSPPKGEGIKSKSVGHLSKSAGDLIPRNLRNSEASGRLIIRVDTVFIERWHTQTIREPTPPPPGGGREGASKFYKNCTLGFWVLLILFLGGFAFRIFRLFYLRR